MNPLLKKVTFVFFIALSLSIKIDAHPWGGLVIDANGNIYFTFICPIADDDHHYACVWKITPSKEKQHMLKSLRSPSDIILSRNLNRDIFAAERSGQSPNYNTKLWKIESSDNQLLIPNTTNQNQFHIQSISVTENQEIYFAKDNNIYFRDSLNQVHKINNQNFERINLTALGPNQKLYFLSGDDLFIYDGAEFKLLISNLKKRNPENLPFSGANIFFDMAVDDKENVYLAYYGNREVIKISPQGITETILKSEEPWSPHGIDFFNGEIYILESTVLGGKWWKFWEEDPGIIPRIRKISANGSVSIIYNYKN